MKKYIAAMLTMTLLFLTLVGSALAVSPLHALWELPEDTALDEFLQVFEEKTGSPLIPDEETEMTIAYLAGDENASPLTLFGYQADVELIYYKESFDPAEDESFPGPGKMEMNIYLTWPADGLSEMEALQGMHQSFENTVAQIKGKRGEPDDADFEFFSDSMPADEPGGGGAGDLPRLTDGSFDYQTLETVYDLREAYSYDLSCQWGLDVAGGVETCIVEGFFEPLGDDDFDTFVLVRYYSNLMLNEEDLGEINFYKSIRQPVENFLVEE